MSNRIVATLANDDRLKAIARTALGGPAVPFRATLFAKTGEANWLIAWHQDTALPLNARFDATGWGPWSLKAGVLHAHAPASALSRVVALRVHLDASTARNGPLRVIPGSHSLGILSDRQALEYVATHEQQDCLTPRGGIIAMRPLILHASSKAQTAEPRRVLHIEYADALDLGPGIRLAIA